MVYMIENIYIKKTFTAMSVKWCLPKLPKCLRHMKRLHRRRSKRLVSKFHFWRKCVGAGAGGRWVDGWCWEVWRHSDISTPLLSITKLFVTAALHTVFKRYLSRRVRGYSKLFLTSGSHILQLDMADWEDGWIWNGRNTWCWIRGATEQLAGNCAQNPSLVHSSLYREWRI